MTDRDLRGAELAREFFAGVVEPLLNQSMPGLGYAAARLGSGSDVLGLDDEMSRDHDWGCRLTLLVDEDARDQMPRISRMLEQMLPERFGDFPVRFPVTWDPSVSHNVEVATVADFAASRLGVDPAGGMSALDWLTVTGQSVLEVTAGPVFADRTRTLAAVRSLLAWYPPAVERYVLAAGWQRICQVLPMAGRTAEAGADEALETSRPARSTYDSPEAAGSHRSASRDGCRYPENTLAAFRHSVSAGFPVIEVDLRATAEGHIVIMHDETVDRTTSGTGEVRRMTLAEVRSLDAGSHAGHRFAGEPVPTYPGTLEALRGTGATLILDIKQDAMLDNEHVVRLTEQHGEDPGVIIAARSITDLLDFRRLSPGLRSLGLVPGLGSGPPHPAAIEEFARVGAGIIRLWPQWILAGSQDAPPGQSPLVQRLHDLGKPTWATADTLYGDISPERPREDLTELVRLGVDGIITNLPALLRDVLAAEGRP